MKEIKDAKEIQLYRAQLSAYMRATGISQRAIARLAGVNSRIITSLLRGEKLRVSIEKQNVLFAALSKYFETIDQRLLTYL
jgi:transcriptional regulator with XRE-family HTH domain